MPVLAKISVQIKKFRGKLIISWGYKNQSYALIPLPWQLYGLRHQIRPVYLYLASEFQLASITKNCLELIFYANTTTENNYF